jgi:quinol monooxygenase YgiN
MVMLNEQKCAVLYATAPACMILVNWQVYKILFRWDINMVVEIIRYDITPESTAHFLQAYKEAGTYLNRSTHCLSYEVVQGIEEPNHFIVRIEWDSVEGHMQGFRAGPEFQPFFALVKSFFNAILEMKHYSVIATPDEQDPT